MCTVLYVQRRWGEGEREERRSGETLAKWVNQNRLLLRQEWEGRGEEKNREEDVSEQTEGGLRDEVTALACSVFKQNGEHHLRTLLQMCPVALVSAADLTVLPALSSPPLHGKGRTLLPSARGYRGGGEREGSALSLSASQLTLLRCLNSHFLYKIDALTAALVCTRPCTGTVQWDSSASSQPSCKKGAFLWFHASSLSPLLSSPLLSSPLLSSPLSRPTKPHISSMPLQHHNPFKFFHTFLLCQFPL